MSTPALKSPEGQRALLRFLHREGKIAADDVTRLMTDAQAKNQSAGELLEAEGRLTEKDLATLLATTLHLRLIDLTSYPFDPQMSRELKEAVATRYDVVPIRVNGNTIEVVGELRANGSTVRESAAAAGGQGRSLGELLERAANDSLQKCVDTLLRNGR
jgi:hypothetical protein